MRVSLVSIDGKLPTALTAGGALIVAGQNATGSSTTVNPVVAGGIIESTTITAALITDSNGRLIVQARHERIGRTAHLASGTLPASGAVTAQTAYTVPAGVRAVTAYVVYTRGAIGGRVKLRPIYSNGTELAQEVSITSSGSSGGTVQDAVELREILGPVVDTASAVTFAVEFDIPAGCTTFNLLAAEAGVTATPGTCLITLTGRYGS